MWAWVTIASQSLPLNGAPEQQLVPEGVGPYGLADDGAIKGALLARAAEGNLFVKVGGDPTAALPENPVASADAYVDKLAPVLLNGVEPHMRSFLQRSVAGEPFFTVALDFGCLRQQGLSQTGVAASDEPGLTRWSDPAIQCHANGAYGLPNTLHVAHSPGEELPEWHTWYGDEAWRQKYAAEAWIPQLIEKSVWNHRERPGRASMTMPVLFTSCMEIRDHFQYCNGMRYDDSNEASQNAFGQMLDTSGMPDEDVATVYTADYGPCMKGRTPCLDESCRAATRGTVLLNNGDLLSPECFNVSKDVVIPTSTLVNPNGEAARLSFANATELMAIASTPDWHTERTQLAYFPRGNAFKTRATVYDFFQGDPEIRAVAREAHAPYLASLATSKFCIQADGMAAWSPRIAEFLAVGCVPVIISARLVPPLHRTLDWSKFAVMHKIEDLAGLKPRLQQLVEDGTYSKMLENVLLARSAFVYDQTAQRAQVSGVLPMIMFEMALLHARSASKDGKLKDELKTWNDEQFSEFSRYAVSMSDPKAFQGLPWVTRGPDGRARTPAEEQWARKLSTLDPMLRRLEQAAEEAEQAVNAHQKTGIEARRELRSQGALAAITAIL